MGGSYPLLFSRNAGKRIQKASRDGTIRDILARMLDRIELLGPDAGKLVDTHFQLFEVKSKRPPIRLYYRHYRETNHVLIIDFQTKTSGKKQREMIDDIRKILSNP